MLMLICSVIDYVNFSPIPDLFQMDMAWNVTELVKAGLRRVQAIINCYRKYDDDLKLSLLNTMLA